MEISRGCRSFWSGFIRASFRRGRTVSDVQCVLSETDLGNRGEGLDVVGMDCWNKTALKRRFYSSLFENPTNETDEAPAS